MTNGIPALVKTQIHFVAKVLCTFSNFLARFPVGMYNQVRSRKCTPTMYKWKNCLTIVWYGYKTEKPRHHKNDDGVKETIIQIFSEYHNAIITDGPFSSAPFW